jgi:hypothetical protein
MTCTISLKVQLEPSDSIHGKITGEAVIYFEKHGSFRGILGH